MSGIGLPSSSHLKHCVVDLPAGFLIGSTLDHLFSLVNAQAPNDARTTALLVGKVLAQFFSTVSVGYGVSESLYPGGSADDVTGGFLYMWAMFQASPNMRRDIQSLSDLYQNWIHQYLDLIVKDVHTSAENQ